jgi:hypothetical protein
MQSSGPGVRSGGGGWSLEGGSVGGGVSVGSPTGGVPDGGGVGLPQSAREIVALP